MCPLDAFKVVYALFLEGVIQIPIFSWLDKVSFFLSSSSLYFMLFLDFLIVILSIANLSELHM